MELREEVHAEDVGVGVVHLQIAFKSSELDKMVLGSPFQDVEEFFPKDRDRNKERTTDKESKRLNQDVQNLKCQELHKGKKKKQPQKTEEMKLSKFKKNTQNQRM